MTVELIAALGAIAMALVGAVASYFKGKSVAKKTADAEKAEVVNQQNKAALDSAQTRTANDEKIAAMPAGDAARELQRKYTRD